jgi:hypothetical protein
MATTDITSNLPDFAHGLHSFQTHISELPHLHGYYTRKKERRNKQMSTKKKERKKGNYEDSKKHEGHKYLYAIKL